MTSSSHSSGLKTNSTLINTGKGRLNAILMTGDGTNAGTLTIYDNTTGAGTVIAQVAVFASRPTAYISFPSPVSANTGLYASLSGTGASYVIHYGG